MHFLCRGKQNVLYDILFITIFVSPSPVVLSVWFVHFGGIDESPSLFASLLLLYFRVLYFSSVTQRDAAISLFFLLVSCVVCVVYLISPCTILAPFCSTQFCSILAPLSICFISAISPYRLLPSIFCTIMWSSSINFEFMVRFRSSFS